MSSSSSCKGQAAASWNDISSEYANRVVPFTSLWANDMINITKDQVLSNHVVLDLATGTGALAVRVAPFCQQVVAVDFAEEMIDQLKQLPASAPTLTSNIRPLVANAEHLSDHFDPSTFDWVFSNFGVVFCQNLSQAFRQVFSILRPMGCFLFSSWSTFTPAFSTFKNILRQFLQANAIYDHPLLRIHPEGNGLGLDIDSKEGFGYQSVVKNPDYLVSSLLKAGFHVDSIQTVPITHDMVLSNAEAYFDRMSLASVGSRSDLRHLSSSQLDLFRRFFISYLRSHSVPNSTETSSSPCSKFRHQAVVLPATAYIIMARKQIHSKL